MNEIKPRNAANKIQNPALVPSKCVALLPINQQASTLFLQFKEQPQRGIVILGFNQLGYDLVNCYVPINPPKAIAYCTFVDFVTSRAVWRDIKREKKLYGYDIKWSTIYDTNKWKGSNLERESNQKETLDLGKTIVKETVLNPCITVTHYEECVQLVFFLYGIDLKQIENITNELNYTYELQPAEVRNVVRGNMIACKWSGDNLLYRAVVMGVDEQNSQVNVRFIDFGNTGIADEIFFVPTDHELIPPLVQQTQISEEMYNNFCTIEKTGHTIAEMSFYANESSHKLSHTVMSSKQNEAILEQLECPICTNHMNQSPIYQDSQGHMICNECHDRSSECPLCRGPLERIRNLALEKIIPHVVYPCKYMDFGCTVSLTQNKKHQHEEKCHRRPCKCPHSFSACDWQGSLDAVIQHLCAEHSNISYTEGWRSKFNLNLSTVDSSYLTWIAFQKFDEYGFLVKVKKANGKCYIDIQKVDVSVEKFLCTVVLNGKQGQRLYYQSKQKTIHDNFNEKDCFIIDWEFLQTQFIDVNLCIEIEIEKK